MSFTMGSVFLLHLVVYFYCSFQGSCLSYRSQSSHSALWRHRVQWQNSGRVYSLLSLGSEYQPPRRRNPAAHAPSCAMLLLSSRNHTSTSLSEPGMPHSSNPGNNQTQGVEHVNTQGQRNSSDQLWFQASRARSRVADATGKKRTREHATRARYQSPASPAYRQQSQTVNATTINGVRQDVMHGNDLYNPYKYSEDNSFLNSFDTSERRESRQRSGHGLQHLQYGKIQV